MSSECDNSLGRHICRDGISHRCGILLVSIISASDFFPICIKRETVDLLVRIFTEATKAEVGRLPFSTPVRRVVDEDAPTS